MRKSASLAPNIHRMNQRKVGIYMKRSNLIPLIPVLLLLCGLTIASSGAVTGARAALETCGWVIIPCLFPFLTISLLINRLGLPVWLGSKLQTPMGLLFGVSGTGAGVFILGLLGGYPGGAAVIADLMERGDLEPTEAKKLLAFCNNSGPAFLIGAMGIGIFQSAAAGLLLYGVHILAAIITGLFLSGTERPPTAADKVFISSVGLSAALPEAMKKAVPQILQICGYVVFFGAICGVLDEVGILSELCGILALYTPLTLHQARGLCMGFLELGCGIGAMAGSTLTPANLTLCSLIAGFGGLSVCFQTAGVLHQRGIGLRHHILGRLCCGGIGAFLMYTISSILL